MACCGIREAPLHSQGATELITCRWTEPAILILIIANVVVLAIQAAKPLNTPRADDGYFKSWENTMLLVLFSNFTCVSPVENTIQLNQYSLEMFARIVITGLILDPDTSLRTVLFSPSGVVPTVERRMNRAQTQVKRSVSKSAATAKTTWRSRSVTGDATTKKPATIFSEAPFQVAVAKQQSLSADGRPYLRHSWHRIDMIAVFAFWITFILAITGQEATATRHIYIFRALSVLRAGRLLVITSGTTTILRSLKRAGPLLITVAYFLIFAAGIFSIIGVQSFRGSFRRQCTLTDPNNSTNTISLSQQCGGYLDPDTLQRFTYLGLDGTPAKVGAKGYICPLDQVCQVS